jgi:hypothetical protein
MKNIKLYPYFKGLPLYILDLETGEVILCFSIKKTAKIVNTSPYFLTECLKNSNFFKNKKYIVSRQSMWL